MKKLLLFLCLFTFVFTFNVNAEEEIEYSTSLIRYTIDGTTSNLNIDNYLNFDPGEVVSYLAPRIWFPTALEQNKTYKIQFTLGWRPSEYIGYLEDRTTAEQFRLVFGNPTFWGSIEGSALTGVIENPFNVATCSYIQQEDQTYRFDVICYVQPNTNLKYVNIRWNLVNQNSDTLIAATIRHLRYQNMIISYQPSTTDSLLNQQVIIQQETNNSINNINNSINDTDVSESENAFGEFFNGFTTNTHGLTGIITAPLQLIGSITSSTCSDLSLPLPYVNKNLTLPCMSSIYYSFFGNFFTIYQTITFGIISYWVIIRIFNLVKDFKNPEHDEIEVLEL